MEGLQSWQANRKIRKPVWCRAEAATRNCSRKIVRARTLGPWGGMSPFHPPPALIENNHLPHRSTPSVLQASGEPSASFAKSSTEVRGKKRVQERPGEGYRGGLVAQVALPCFKFSKLCGKRGEGTWKTLKMLLPLPFPPVSKIGLSILIRLQGRLSLRCCPGPCNSGTDGPAAALENYSKRRFA